ncbi:MAG: FAD-dependent oxidoreductase, partial [Erysipelotrichaceae bacterium]|nr:FAD-dependent oxidoreductase [Erysipelotrichaceae bacterium]
MALHVMDEANRCLQCKNPMCRKGCPINTNIPEAIRLLKENKLNEAGKMLFYNNPLTTVCSLVCNHENQCEGHCVLGIKGSPVHFSTIENYISTTYANQMTEGPKPSNGIKVAIVGSGPAGLTIAVILARYGYQVTIFDIHDKIGGVLRYGIPEFRLPKSVLDDFEYRHLRLKGIKVRPNTTIGTSITIDDLFRDGYKAVFVGTGTWRPKTLGIKGESLGNVHFAIDYLASPDVYHLGNNVIVIGVGNAAMDVARTAIRKGSRNVTCFARRDTVSASQYEFSYAKLEGV